MADAALSAAETALENQRIGGLQVRVVVLCMLVQTCDGYDLNAVAWAVPPPAGVRTRPAIRAVLSDAP